MNSTQKTSLHIVVLLQTMNDCGAKALYAVAALMGHFE